MASNQYLPIDKGVHTNPAFLTSLIIQLAGKVCASNVVNVTHTVTRDPLNLFIIDHVTGSPIVTIKNLFRSRLKSNTKSPAATAVVSLTCGLIKETHLAASSSAAISVLLKGYDEAFILYM